MNATTNTTRHSFRQRIKHWLHSAVALVFLCLPLLMLLQFAGGFATNTVTAIREHGLTESIAEAKVASDKGILFDEPIVTVTFDDGWRSIATNGAAILADENIATTQYIIADSVGKKGYMTLDQIHALKAAGHEIASHGVSHSALGNADDGFVLREFNDSKSALVRNDLVNEGNVHFAYPYGSYSYRTNDLGAPIYASLRNTNATTRGGIDDQDVNIEVNFDRTFIIGYTVVEDTDFSDIERALDYAVENNGWLVLALHQVGEENSEYSITESRLRQLISLIRERDIKTMTLGDALASREQ